MNEPCNWQSLNTWDVRIDDWDWCSLHGELRDYQGKIRAPTAPLAASEEPVSGPDFGTPIPTHPASEIAQIRPSHAPDKHQDPPDAEARRQEYLQRAKYYFHDRNRFVPPTEEQLQQFADGLEHWYQVRASFEYLEEMHCTCPFQFPKITYQPTVITHHETCSMAGLNRLGDRMPFDGKEGYYWGGTPRHGGTT